MLRINGGGTFRVAGQAHGVALATVVERLNGGGSVAGAAFQGVRQLPCTVGMYHEKGCAEPWQVLTNVAPTQCQAWQCQACWYGLRGCIGHGFKLPKREGWQWQRSRMQDPQRVARFWLVLAVATL